MPRRPLISALFLTAAFCAVLVAWQPGFAQPDDLSASASGNSRGAAIAKGVDLERSRKWIEAIEFYEKAVKSYPETPELDYGLRRAKIYFGIDRRYTDKSFRSQLLRMDRGQALNLLDEILSKVEAHYVDAVTPTSFVAHGTESLYLALNDDRFREENVPARNRGAVKPFRDRLRNEFWNRKVPSRDAARQLIIEMGETARAELGVPAVAVTMEYIFGGCNALDDYSGYLTPSRLNDLYGNIEGEFVGLGIEMRAENGKGMLLVNVLDGGPAEQGGVLAGEHIVSIDGRDCRNMTTDEAAGYLQGTTGSRVTLELEADGQVRALTLARRAVVVKSLPVVEMVDRANGVGYIKMTSFQKSSTEELDAALARLRAEGMRALIWDVRGNPGGLLSTSVEVLDRFINEGVLVSTRGRTADQNWSYTARRPGTLDIPLVLLIDGDSASASEIVAGAIRDHGRGTIVGRKSYGKWSVQSIFPAGAGTGLRLTTAKFYSPKGLTLGKIGVEPDVVVEVAGDERPRSRTRGRKVDPETDADVRKALEILSDQVAGR